jgi:hypothetical protein
MNGVIVKRNKSLNAIIGLSLGLTFSLSSVQVLASAEPGIFDQQCRIKAKEQAAETYRGCVTENRKAHLDQIKSEYQSKLKALKDEYTQELQKMSGATNTAQPVQNSTQFNKPPAAPGKRFAGKGLPHKKAKTMTTQNSGENDGLSLQLRSDPTTAPLDESSMDLPEPIPVDDGSPQL